MHRPFLVGLLTLLAACTQDTEPADGHVAVDGCVALPADTTAATVINGLGEAPVQAGCFRIEASAAGPQLAIALSEAGAPLVMGWLSADDATLDARSTAEVLTWLAVDGWTVPGEAQQPLRDALADDATLDGLADAVQGALDDGDDAFAADRADVAAALGAVVHTLLPPPTSKVDEEGPPVAGATLVNPSAEQSGVRVTNLTGLQEIGFTQRYRRAAFAFVDRVSTFDEAGAEVPSPKEVARLDLPSVQALAGGVGTIGQILAATQAPGGLAGSEDVAYVPRTFGPVAVPNEPQAKKTRYRVAVVGPGAGTGDLSELSADEVEKQASVTYTFVIRDVLVPLITQILLPASKVNEYLEHDMAGSVVGDLTTVLLSAGPQLAEQVSRGEIDAAVKSAIDLVLSSGTLRDQLFAGIADEFSDFRTAESIAGSSRALDAAAAFGRVTGALDLALSSTDLVFLGASLKQADMANVWTVDSIDAIVRLDPEATTVPPDGSVTFTANVVDAGDDVVFEYRFHTDGAFGTLANDLHTGDDVTSSSPTITYRAGSDEGEETVEVAVYEVRLSERVFVGDAVATVEVTEDCDPQQAQASEPLSHQHDEPYDADTVQRKTYVYYLFEAVPDITTYELVVDLNGERPVGLTQGTRTLTRWRGLSGSRSSTYFTKADVIDDLGWLGDDIGAALDDDDLLYLVMDELDSLHDDGGSSIPDYETWYAEAMRRYGAADVSFVPVCPN